MPPPRLPHVLLYSTVVYALGIVGVVVYLAPALARMQWLSYVLAVATGLSAVWWAWRTSQLRLEWRESPVAVAAVAFMTVALLSTLVNRSSPLQLVLGAKSLFPMAGLWIALAVGPFTRREIRRLFVMLVGIASVQWVFTLWQFLTVRRERLATDPRPQDAADSVVGTFEGSMHGGGLSGVLALFLVCALLMLVAFHRNHLLPRRATLVLGALITIPLILMEVKAVFVYLPLGYLLLFADQVPQQPRRYVGGLVAVLVAIGLLTIAYDTLHWQPAERIRAAQREAQSVTTDSPDGERPFFERATDKFTYTFRPRTSWARSARPALLGRVEALTLWVNERPAHPPSTLVIGHGLGEARTVGLRQGALAAQYAPLKIDYTGTALLLWETGVFGMLAVSALFMAAGVQAARVAHHTGDAFVHSVASGLVAVFPLLYLSIFYRHSIPYSATMMVVCMLAFGLLSWTQRESRRHRRASPRRVVKPPGQILTQ